VQVAQLFPNFKETLVADKVRARIIVLTSHDQSGDAFRDIQFLTHEGWSPGSITIGTTGQVTLSLWPPVETDSE
jgi:hypothetical protein